MKSILNQLDVEIKLYFRQPMYLLFSILMPVLSFYFLGSSMNRNNYGGNDFFSMFIPGFCMMILFSTGVYNIGNQLVSDKEKGIYKRIMATPLSLKRFIGVILIKGFLLASIGFIIIILMAKFKFNVSIGMEKIPYIVAYFIFILFALSIGVGIAVLTRRLNTYSILMMVLFFPMFILSDAAMSISMFPSLSQKLANINPLYHSNKILRYFWSEKMHAFYEKEIWLSFLILGIIFISIYTLVYINRKKLYEI